MIMSSEALRMIYIAYVQSVISYNIIFWGNAVYTNSIFKIQKRIIRVIMNSSSNSCCELFKKLNMLPVQTQYIFSLLLFVVENRDLEIYIYLILKYIILVQDTVQIYICLLQV